MKMSFLMIWWKCRFSLKSSWLNYLFFFFVYLDFFSSRGFSRGSFSGFSGFSLFYFFSRLGFVVDGSPVSSSSTSTFVFSSKSEMSKSNDVANLIYPLPVPDLRSYCLWLGLRGALTSVKSPALGLRSPRCFLSETDWSANLPSSLGFLLSAGLAGARAKKSHVSDCVKNRKEIG